MLRFFRWFFTDEKLRGHDMTERHKILTLAIGLVFSVQPILAAEDLLIQVHLFRAVWNVSNQVLKPLEVLTTTSRPELSSLKEKAGGPESVLTATVIDGLLEIYGLDTIEDMFVHKMPVSGKGVLPYDNLIKGTELNYRVTFSPKKLPGQEIDLRVVVTCGKNYAASAATIIDHRLVLNLGDPVILAVPFQGYVYFAMVLVKPEETKEMKLSPKTAPKVELATAPKAMREIIPSYPGELRERRIGGVVGALIQIDEKGKVETLVIEKPAHPYLNYALVQALRQWMFEPVFIKGKPARARFQFSYSFYPSVYQPALRSEDPWPEPSAYSPEVLKEILEKCGSYSRKIAGAVLDFICEETIRETRFNLMKDLKWKISGTWVKRRPQSQEEEEQMRLRGELDGKFIPDGRVQIMDPKQTARNNYLCDYQIVRKRGTTEERRILLKENGRRNEDRTKLLTEKRYSAVSPLFVPPKIFLPERQTRFFYRIGGEEKLWGRRAYIVEARPKSDDEDGVWGARAWIDAENFLILKCEIEGIPVEGYEDVLNDCSVLNIRPEFKATHEYRTEKGGLLFPSRSHITVAYYGIGTEGAVPKNDISLTYDKYKFFIVETEHQIIK
jgi:TonB family protein